MILTVSATPFKSSLMTNLNGLKLEERGIPLYYWEARAGQDFTNFGDILSEKIVERIVGHRILTTFTHSLLTQCGKSKRSRHHHCFSCGRTQSRSALRRETL